MNLSSITFYNRYIYNFKSLLSSIRCHDRFGFVHIGRVGSVFATLMVTIERFVAVWCPLKRLKSTKTLLGISIIGSVLYNIPRFLEFESRSVCTHQRISVPCNQIYEDPDLALRYDNSTISMVGWEDYLTKSDNIHIYIYIGVVNVYFF